ncbi:MAG: prolipoprotein diacylglyceryl transferase [Bradymonadaceae bacterium]|nr:prolipoprotein diacylglyceryl transferase [Lujinxingiaceae bacterium]
MWSIDPGATPAQSVFFGVGIWMAFAYLWSFAPVRGVSRLDALALFGLGGVGGMLGARLMSLGVRAWGGERWQWADLPWLLNPVGAGYASVGFLVGAGLTILLMTRAWSVLSRARMFDLIVVSGLLGMSVARLGCIFNGCDFGRITSLPWAIRYAQGSGPWARHHALGLISAAEPWSAPTHAFALYLAGGAMVLVAWVSLGKRWKRSPPGARAFFALTGYLAWHFGVEFFREPSMAARLGAVLNGNQLALFVALFVAVAIWRHRFQPREVSDG